MIYQERQIISIHALLAESDYILVNTFLAIFEFLSTLSLRRATGCFGRFAAGSTYFYPRSPCGERRGTKRSANPKNHFYPRSPCGERPEYFLA